MMAKYFATSLAMEKVVSAPRVMRSCLPISTTSISFVGSLSRSTMLAASFAACVPAFMARPTSAWARAGASFVPSPIMATSLPPACSFRMYSSFVSGVAWARKSSTPDLAAIKAAVRGLSPVIMTVLRPIFRRRAKRSLMWGFRMSSRTTTPTTWLPSATTSGVAPLDAAVSTSASRSAGTVPPFSLTNSITASDAPFRMRLPSGRSTPLMRVWAVKGTNRASGGASSGALAFLLEEPHDALALRRLVGRRCEGGEPPHVGGGIPRDRQECRRVPVPDGDRARLVEEHHVDVARHLDRPAALRDDVRLEGPVHARYAYGGEKGADGGGDEADQKGDEGRHVGAEALERLLDAQVALHVVFRVPRHGPDRDHDDEEDKGEGGKEQREGDLVGASLADGAFHEGDHPVEERLAGPARDLDDYAVREHDRASRDARPVAAGRPDDGRRLSRDGRLVDGGHAFDDLPVTGDRLSCLDDDPVARLEGRRGDLLDGARFREAAGRRFVAGFSERLRLGLAPGFRKGGREVREEHGDEKPCVEGDEIAYGHLAHRPAPMPHRL